VKRQPPAEDSRSASDNGKTCASRAAAFPVSPDPKRCDSPPRRSHRRERDRQRIAVQYHKGYQQPELSELCAAEQRRQDAEKAEQERQLKAADDMMENTIRILHMRLPIVVGDTRIEWSKARRAAEREGKEYVPGPRDV
jgi:hypothetical protein